MGDRSAHQVGPGWSKRDEKPYNYGNRQAYDLFDSRSVSGPPCEKGYGNGLKKQEGTSKNWVEKKCNIDRLDV